MNASNRLGIPLAVLSVREGKPSPTGRYTFTSWRLWNKDAPLVASGLLGPVTLQFATQIPLR